MEDNLTTSELNSEHSIQQRLVRFYDNLSESVALNSFFYDSLEGIFNETDPSLDSQSSLGLNLTVRCLRLREKALLDELRHIVALIRECKSVVHDNVSS